MQKNKNVNENFKIFEKNEKYKKSRNCKPLYIKMALLLTLSPTGSSGQGNRKPFLDSIHECFMIFRAFKFFVAFLGFCGNLLLGAVPLVVSGVLIEACSFIGVARLLFFCLHTLSAYKHLNVF